MKKYQKLILISLLLICFPLFLIYSEEMSEGVRQGLTLCYRSILPALFPAAVICGILNEFLEYLPFTPSKALWLLSHFCGFPLGIRNICRAYRRGIINRRTAIGLSCCCANASPSFLIIYLGGTLLGNMRKGLLLFIGQGMISLLIALGCHVFCHQEQPLPARKSSLTKLLTDGISSATIGCLTLTGYITIFSAISAIPWLSRFHAILEITGGLSEPSKKNLLIFAALIGFSGLSVLLQNAAFLSAEDLPILPMAAGKLIYAFALPIIAFSISRAPLLTLTLFPLFSLFLISFDKYRKRRYNKQERIVY